MPDSSMVILLCRDLVKRGSAQNGIAEDIKFLLTGEDALFHRGQALVKAAASWSKRMTGLSRQTQGPPYREWAAAPVRRAGTR